MSAQILAFTGVQQSKNAYSFSPAEPVIPTFHAGQTVWIVNHETETAAVGTVINQSGEWVHVRPEGHSPVMVHVSALEPHEPEAA
jgi:hypothetical protein